jgi:hypothetical protein
MAIPESRAGVKRRLFFRKGVITLSAVCLSPGALQPVTAQTMLGQGWKIEVTAQEMKRSLATSFVVGGSEQGLIYRGGETVTIEVMRRRGAFLVVHLGLTRPGEPETATAERDPWKRAADALRRYADSPELKFSPDRTYVDGENGRRYPYYGGPAQTSVSVRGPGKVVLYFPVPSDARRLRLRASDGFDPTELPPVAQPEPLPPAPKQLRTKGTVTSADAIRGEILVLAEDGRKVTICDLDRYVPGYGRFFPGLGEEMRLKKVGADFTSRSKTLPNVKSGDPVELLYEEGDPEITDLRVVANKPTAQPPKPTRKPQPPPNAPSKNPARRG